MFQDDWDKAHNYLLW